MFVEVFLVFFLLYVASLLLNKTDKKLPPGPWGLPLIGYWPITELEPCRKLKEKYGNLFMTKVGAVRFLFIADFKLTKEALSSLEYADRPTWSSVKLFEKELSQDHASGIIFSNGHVWRHNRRFLLRHLRDLGMGKSRIETFIIREVEDLVEDFKTLTEKPNKLPFSINICVLNVIWQLIASHRYEFNDEKVTNFMKLIHKIQDSTFTSAIEDFYPFLRYFLPVSVIYHFTRSRMRKAEKAYTDLFQEFLDDHLNKLDPNDPRDLMDDYLIEMKIKKTKELTHFSYMDLMRNTFDLFVAGNDTTSNMTRWVLLYMAKFTKVQEKIQKLIDEVVPSDTIPRLEHRDRLSYLDAIINEVQRHCTMIPIGVFRTTTADGELDGYFIPKDTTVLPTVGFFHKDPKYWTNPEEFNPDRFLDANGKCINSCEGFMPFGIGKRQCLGEPFARMELYFIVGALLQNYTFGPPDGSQIDITPTVLPLQHLPNKEQLFSIKKRK